MLRSETGSGRNVSETVYKKRLVPVDRSFRVRSGCTHLRSQIFFFCVEDTYLLSRLLVVPRVVSQGVNVRSIHSFSYHALSSAMYLDEGRTVSCFELYFWRFIFLKSKLKKQCNNLIT